MCVCAIAVAQKNTIKLCVFLFSSRCAGQRLPSDAEPSGDDLHPPGLYRLCGVRGASPHGQPQALQSKIAHDCLQPQHGFIEWLHCVWGTADEGEIGVCGNVLACVAIVPSTVLTDWCAPPFSSWCRAGPRPIRGDVTSSTTPAVLKLSGLATALSKIYLWA